MQTNGNDYANFEQPKTALTSPTAMFAKELGTDSHKLQLMKASFFNDDDTDNKSGNFKFIAKFIVNPL